MFELHFRVGKACELITSACLKHSRDGIACALDAIGATAREDKPLVVAGHPSAPQPPALTPALKNVGVRSGASGTCPPDQDGPIKHPSRAQHPLSLILLRRVQATIKATIKRQSDINNALVPQSNAAHWRSPLQRVPASTPPSLARLNKHRRFPPQPSVHLGHSLAPHQERRPEPRPAFASNIAASTDNATIEGAGVTFVGLNFPLSRTSLYWACRDSNSAFLLSVWV